MGAPQVTDSKPLTLVWRTAEVTADRPLSLAASPTAREKCKAIWRLNKARELARKAADEAAGMIAQAGADEVKLAQQVQEVLAHLKKPIADPLLAARFVERTPPEFEAAKLPLQKQFGLVPMVAQFDPRHDGIVYETDKMKEDLLANKDKPVGSTFVFTDRPETTLYLTVVSGRERKSADDFRNFVLYPNREAINQVRQQQQRMMQLGQPPKTHPLAPEEIAPRYAAAARDADRQQAVALLKAEFGYTDENPKLDQKDQ
jgi:hypothetical protein